MRKMSVIILFSLSLANIYPQTGGDNVYEFLNLSPNAYISSLGGFHVSAIGNDPSLSFLNPALTGPQSHKNMALNYINYFAGINYGSMMYSMHYDSLGSFSAGINYLNYGNFDLADESGNINGKFTAAEYAFNLIYSRNINEAFSIGINLKPVLSQLESYISFGVLMDIGVTWQGRDELVSAGLVIRNLGAQITSYTGIHEKIPFEIAAGLSARLQHAPFRFSLTARHLGKYDLSYEYTTDPLLSERSGMEEIADNIMRHFIFGAELIPGNNFFISTGLNYQRRKELQYEARASTVGFSLGAGIKTSVADIVLSRSRYHLAGASTTFSVVLKPALFEKLK